MSETVWEGEAPGRLDVLGGVGDYSGSLVLQMPTKATTRVRITALPEPALLVQSEQAGEIRLALDWLRGVFTGVVSGWKARLDEAQVPHWARYSVGCFLLFGRESDWWPTHGLRLAIRSDVPTSMGVSSSAALEVATLRALEAVSGLRLPGAELAKLGQCAENQVVGAPCGLMDQLASAHGTRGALLPILCRPDILGPPIPLPEGIIVVGWPSGVKHAVSDAPYATARTAAFMGKKILEDLLSHPLQYLTDLAPSQVREVGEDRLPGAMGGAEFISQYGGVDDPLSTVEPGRIYPVRAAASFPVEENFRCGLAAQLLRGIDDENRAEMLPMLGELMYQAHQGYSSIGLGCPETDMIVEAIRKLGSVDGFYGARVSGGGSGGTVAVLLERSSLPELDELAREATPGPRGSETRIIQ